MKVTVMKILAPLVILAAGALSGCSLTATNATIAADVSASLPSICAAVSSAHIAIVTVESANSKIPARIVTDEQAAFDVASNICANPPVDVSSIMTTVANSYAIVMKDLAAAKAVKP